MPGRSLAAGLRDAGGGVDFMRCPSTCSTVEAPGALEAPVPALKWDGCHGGAHFAYPTAVGFCRHYRQVASGDTALGTGKGLDPISSADWLGVIAGDDVGSEIELAAEMAELFANDSPLRLVPVQGDGGLNNISRLLHDPHIDAGFVSTDVLADTETQNSSSNLTESLQVVARLCPQEVHLLARAGVHSL